MTGLYYDPNSQYYYNNETGAYLYWSTEHSTYLLASSNGSSQTQTDTKSSNTPTVTTSLTGPAAVISSANECPPAPIIESIVSTLDTQNSLNEEKKDSNGKKDIKHDKVKVAKKIVKDMEKWAKQLNQKKEMNMLQPMVITKDDEPPIVVSKNSRSGYADVGFSILENKDRPKMSIDLSSANTISAAQQHINKLVSSYGSDSDTEQNDHATDSMASEKDYVDFDKLTCLLCKRAFQSQDTLNKHLKMSNLHKENLQKYNLSRGVMDDSSNSNALSYRDRAKERRLKYGECDPPPPNRSRERFEKEIEKHTAALQAQSSSTLASMPIGENNVGNRLLQKMGWTEGQGLGRSNQGRTNIIEVWYFLNKFGTFKN